ncbi:oxidoreductase NAD-binding domain-containing protein 1-like [Gigantopelta aegis]|uniref:oxidoreductase NAD-binding domain-containing protein 1-like n=1 Tax=Gigantopelta aegis TaxID=1735272 RepID=UPI001B88AC84|nr:oxidoreductase NAD-binding domain-containing protein 1-like [Gigantopelta aegis]
MFKRFIHWCLRQSTIQLKNMSSASSTHLERTSDNTRYEISSKATVKEIISESSIVKSLILKIHNKKFMFKAGQWVDTHIPGVETVGGFSMCSAPSLLQERGLLQLAVKWSSHPPADWIHKKCKVGDEVELKAGGDFYFDPPPGEFQWKLVLIAGGIGINPLFSILQHAVHLTEQSAGTNRPKVILLYSAKTPQELIFKDNIDKINKKYKNISVQYFVTQQTGEEGSGEGIIEYSRINLKQIQQAVEKVKMDDPDDPQVFVCGPSTLTDSVVEHLTKCSVPQENVHYEKWW